MVQTWCTPHLNKANWETFRSGLVSFYEDIAIQYDISTLWTHFHDTLIDLIATKKTARKRCSAPWINANIRRMIRKRNKLFSKYKTSHLPELNERYKSQKQDVQKEIRKSHQQYINSLISSEGENGTFPSSNWTYIKNLKKDNANIPPLHQNFKK